jgi:CRP-like cAMP-binding protein
MTTTTTGFNELYDLLSHKLAPQSFSAGDVIFEQGAPGDRMYIVREGSVALKNGETLMDTVGVPGMFGEMALIDNEPRALTAVAATDAQLVSFTARQFWVLVHETPYFAQLVMTVMARRIRSANQST